MKPYTLVQCPLSETLRPHTTIVDAHLTFCILLLFLESLTLEQPGGMALLLAGKACLLLLLLPLHRGHRVQKLLVAPALVHLLLILVQLAADGGHGGIQPLDLHQLQHQAKML